MHSVGSEFKYLTSTIPSSPSSPPSVIICCYFRNIGKNGHTTPFVLNFSSFLRTPSWDFVPGPCLTQRNFLLLLHTWVSIFSLQLERISPVSSQSGPQTVQTQKRSLLHIFEHFGVYLLWQFAQLLPVGRAYDQHFTTPNTLIA